MQNIKSHTIILPILGVIFALMLGWNTVSAQNLEEFPNPDGGIVIGGRPTTDEERQQIEEGWKTGDYSGVADQSQQQESTGNYNIDPQNPAQVTIIGNEIASLSSGTSFTLTLSDNVATAAAEEYLGKYMDTIKEAINEAIGMSLDISSPTVTFGEDTLTLNLKAGKGILKVNVSASANVVWEDNDLHVTVTELNVPIVSVPVETANSFIAGPLKNIITELLKSYDVQSFKLSDGIATLSAAKK